MKEYSHNYFQLAFNMSPLPSLILEKEKGGSFIIREANHSYLRLIEGVADDVIGISFADLIFNSRFVFQEPELLKSAPDKVTGTNNSDKLIQRVKRRDNGEYRFWLIETQSLPADAANNAVFVLQTVTDITESIMAGEIRQEGGVNDSKNPGKASLHTHPDAVFSIDLQGRFLRANDSLLKLAECGEDDILSTSFLLFIVPEEQEIALDLFNTALKGEVIHFEINTITSKGNRKHLAVTNIPMVVNGTVAGVYVLAKDITVEYLVRQELAEEQRQREASVNRMYEALDSITDGFISLDYNWIITYWNSASERIFGINREDLIGKNLWDVYPPSKHQDFYSAYQKALYEKVVVRFSTYSARFNKHFDVSVYPSDEGLSIYFHDYSEKVEIEKKIRESAEKYDLISKATSDAVWDFDFAADSVTWNKGVKEIFGYSDQVTSFQWWGDHIHPEDAPEVINSIKKLIASRASFWQKEYRFRCNDGTYRYVLDRGFLMLNDQDEVVRIIGSMQDISRIREKERELQESLLLYKLVTNVTSDAIYEWDLNTNKIQWNESIGPLFGYDKSDDPSLEYWWVDKMHPQDLEKVHAVLMDAIEHKLDRLKREYRFRCSDGKYKFIKDSCTIIYQDEKAVKIIGAIKDINDLKRANAENERLVNLINKVNNLIIISDPDMRILWVNEAFVSHCGYSREEVYGKTPMELLHGEETNAETVALLKAQLGRGQSFSGELVNYTKNGEKYWIHLNCTPVFDEDDGFKGFVAVSNVITERKEREGRLQKQTAALRNIAWLSSHEVRKPAANILGILALLRHADMQEEVNEYVGLLEQAAEELDRIVRDISRKINSIEIE